MEIDWQNNSGISNLNSTAGICVTAEHVAATLSREWIKGSGESETRGTPFHKLSTLVFI